jgi:hypothetical protein
MYMVVTECMAHWREIVVEMVVSIALMAKHIIVIHIINDFIKL